MAPLQLLNQAFCPCGNHTFLWLVDSHEDRLINISICVLYHPSHTSCLCFSALPACSFLCTSATSFEDFSNAWIMFCSFSVRRDSSSRYCKGTRQLSQIRVFSSRGISTQLTRFLWSWGRMTVMWCACGGFLVVWSRTMDCAPEPLPTIHAGSSDPAVDPRVAIHIVLVQTTSGGCCTATILGTEF